MFSKSYAVVDMWERNCKEGGLIYKIVLVQVINLFWLFTLSYQTSDEEMQDMTLNRVKKYFQKNQKCTRNVDMNCFQKLIKCWRLWILPVLPKKTYRMVFYATFNNIPVISWRLFGNLPVRLVHLSWYQHYTPTPPHTHASCSSKRERHFYRF